MTFINSILTSGFEFEEGEDLLHFKFRMFNIMLSIAMGASLLFALMHDLGLHELGDVHVRSNYFISVIYLLTFFWLRQEKSSYIRVAEVIIVATMIQFTSALIFVPTDEFRLVWFLITVIVSHLVVGPKFGLFIVVLSVLIVGSGNSLFDLNFSNHALTTFVISLLVSSLLLTSYNNKIIAYQAEMLRQNGELKNMVNRDSLTGIMSRSFFMDMANHFFSASLRNKSPIAFLMLDIDYFKRINDTYGHHIGDKMLQLFSDTISSHLRKSDIFGRLGGEEFGIVLFETDRKGAMVLAEKMRHAVEEALYEKGGISVNMTTSIGISEKIENEGSFERMIIHADEALYKAKRSGRNQIALAS